MTSDRAIVDELAAGREVVAIDHARERLDGAVGVMTRGGRAIAISAHRCGLRALPPLESLDQLERLDVGGNDLADLPRLPAQLRELYVYDNRLERLPPLPSTLRVLDANRNRLAALPPLADLDFAYLASNRFAEVQTRGVRYLNVGGNPLRELPIDPAIVELRAEDAGLATLPDAIAELASLRELALRGNALVALPETIGALAQLRVLDLRANRLDTLPDALARLRLAKLDLRWNPLRRRPRWLDDLGECLVYM
jgi:Leucine-rich repeat (LRR) protein